MRWHGTPDEEEEDPRIYSVRWRGAPREEEEPRICSVRWCGTPEEEEEPTIFTTDKPRSNRVHG